jgi:outer membrane lipoprotein-sorting protein
MFSAIRLSHPSRGTFRSSLILRVTLAFLGVSVALLTLLSCAVHRREAEGLVREACPASALELLKENAETIQTVKATLQIRVSMEEPGFVGRVQAGLAAQRPDKARVKVYAGFSEMLDVAIDGDSLWLWVPPKSVMLAGSVEDAAAPFAAGVLVGALREALFPERFCSGNCSSHWVGRGVCRVEEDLAGGSRLSFVEVKSGRLRELLLLNADGDEWLDVRYKNYKQSGKMSFPSRLEISFPMAKLKMRLTFDRVRLNSPVEPGSFRLKLPAGTTVREFREQQALEGEENGGEEARSGSDD